MGKFLEVTMVDGNDEWLRAMRLDAIQIFEDVGNGMTEVLFEGGRSWIHMKISYEELKGILEGEGKRWPEVRCMVCGKRLPCDCSG